MRTNKRELAFVIDDGVSYHAARYIESRVDKDEGGGVYSES